jgi:hypothetical protein
MYRVTRVQGDTKSLTLKKETGRFYANNEGNQGNHCIASSQTTLLSPRKVCYFLSHFNGNGHMSIDILVQYTQSVFSQVRNKIFHNFFSKALKIN